GKRSGHDGGDLHGCHLSPTVTGGTLQRFRGQCTKRRGMVDRLGARSPPVASWPADDRKVAESYTEIIYASASVQPFSSRQLTDLLARARAHNRTVAVSGLLLYHQGSFLQVLEGADSVVGP